MECEGLGGDAGAILRLLRIIDHSYSFDSGWRSRVRRLELRLIRRQLRKLFTS